MSSLSAATHVQPGQSDAHQLQHLHNTKQEAFSRNPKRPAHAMDKVQPVCSCCSNGSLASLALAAATSAGVPPQATATS
eukprot:6168467-Amphidinium_carterae.1